MYKDDEDPVGYAITEPGRGIIEACAHSDEPGIYSGNVFFIKFTLSRRRDDGYRLAFGSYGNEGITNRIAFIIYPSPP